jgi:hypothetical protein
MKYTFTHDDFSQVDANTMLIAIWGTSDSTAVHEEQVGDFLEDRRALYAHIGTKVRVSIQVEPA